jgi:uncharacterized protein (TIGR02246 family)
MRTTFRIPTLAIFALFIPACQPPAQEMAPARTMQEVDDAVESLRAEWVALANADDAAGVAALYTEDAVFVDVYGNAYEGRAAIQAYLQDSFSRSSGTTIQTLDMVFDSNMVAASGTFSQTVEGPEGEMLMTGLWQNVSFFQPDGSLLLRMNQTMLPAEPPPEM